MSNLQVVVELIDKMTGPLTQLTGVVGQFAKGVQEGARAELELQKNAASAAKTQNTLATSLMDVGKALVGLKIAKDVFDAFAASVQAADKMDELAGKTGIAANALKGYQFAAEQSDTSLEGIIGGLNKLNLSIAKSEEESTKQARAFDLLGISTQNADGSLRSSEETFGSIADKFKNLKDGPEKAALAMAIFGQQGKDLIPILNRGSDGIKALRDESEQLGQMGPAAFDAYATSSGNLMDGLGKLNTIFSGLVNVISAEVVPVINLVIDGFIDSFKSGGLLAQILDGIKVVAIGAFIPAMKAIVVVLRGVADTVTLAGKGLGALGAMIAAVASGDLQGAKSIWQAYKDDVAATADAHVDFTKKLWDADNASTAVSNTVDTKTTPSIKGLGKATKDTKNNLTEFQKALKDFDKTLQDIYKEGSVAGYEAQLLRMGKTQEEAARAAKIRAMAIGELNKEMNAQQEDARKAGKAYTPMSADQQVARLQEIETALKVADDVKKANEKILSDEKDKDNLLQKMRTEGQQKILNDFAENQKNLFALRRDGKISELEFDTENAKLQKQLNKDLLTQMYKDNVEYGNAVEDITKQSYDTVLASVRYNLQIATMMLEQGKISQEDYFRYVEDQQARLTALTKQETDQITIFWQEAAKNMQSAMADTFFDVMQGKMTDLGKTFKQMIDRMVANALAANLNDALFGSGFGKTGNMGGLIGKGLSWLSGFAGARASGGPVEAGKAYLVGEKGPEPFIPKVSGTILPNSSLSAAVGSGGNTVQVNITAMDSQDVRRALEKDSRWLADMVRKTGRTYNLGT